VIGVGGIVGGRVVTMGIEEVEIEDLIWNEGGGMGCTIGGFPMISKEVKNGVGVGIDIEVWVGIEVGVGRESVGGEVGGRTDIGVVTLLFLGMRRLESSWYIC
jgi:hypothetical protein